MEIYQIILIIIAIITLVFGPGIIYRIKGKKGNSQSSQLNEQIRINSKILSLERTIPLGDFIEVVWKYRKMKIEIKDIRREVIQDHISLGYHREHTAAEIKFDTGGGLVYGGQYTKEMGVNTFLLIPFSDEYEEPFSVFAFSTSLKYLMRICIKHINEHAKTVTLDIKGFEGS